jgi:hypothetical protein
MPAPDLDLETRILRALCSNPSPRIDDPTAFTAKRAAVLAPLRAHHWQDPEHRVVFEALTLLPGRQATELREQLPAQAARMGFPDVNWEKYFAVAADDSAIEAVVAELLAWAKLP